MYGHGRGDEEALPAEVALPQGFVLGGQLRILRPKHLSQELHDLQPLIVIVTLQIEHTQHNSTNSFSLDSFLLFTQKALVKVYLKT